MTQGANERKTRSNGSDKKCSLHTKLGVGRRMQQEKDIRKYSSHLTLTYRESSPSFPRAKFCTGIVDLS